MKKQLLFVLANLVSLFAYSVTVKVNACYDGYWGEWKGYTIGVIGGYEGMTFYSPYDHPSNWIWRFTISNYEEPSIDVIRKHYKKDIWYEYKGTFEYYITDDCPSIKRLLQTYGYPSISPAKHRVEEGDRPCVKRTSYVTIRIAPYKPKQHPRCYNIFFEDGTAFGISFPNGIIFEQ